MTAGAISPIPKEARPFQGQRAGLVTRLIANTVDGVVVALVALGIWAGAAVTRFLLHPRSFTIPKASLLLQTTVVLFLLVVYLCVGWATTGRTYGAHVMGLRVVNFRGGRLRPLTALVRSAFCVFFPIGLFWVPASRSNRSLQDTVLRSSVIYDWNRRAPWLHVPEVPVAPSAPDAETFE
ncbi:RDD family protein [Angustibacter sp. McL0619]|uniref:RDD family protein n=1 Tax=Angustibacter sp. McL0619 TaxID=3415676 RepID=UPI003CEAF675